MYPQGSTIQNPAKNKYHIPPLQFKEGITFLEVPDSRCQIDTMTEEMPSVTKIFPFFLGDHFVNMPSQQNESVQ